MSADFTEGVRPGGLTGGTEIRILLCYILSSVNSPVTKLQLEEVLLGEELVNYFALAESLALIKEQKLVTENEEGFVITEAGRTVGQTLAKDVPATVRDTAVRGLVRAQQYAAKKANHKSEITSGEIGRHVNCSIDDGTGCLFSMSVYMPDELTADVVKQGFIENGDTVYKLVLAALTGNRTLASDALKSLDSLEQK